MSKLCLQIFWQCWKRKRISFAGNETFKFQFQRKSCFHLKRQPPDKLAIAEEELDDIDIDGIGNLVNLPRLMFIDEECRNIKVVADGREVTRN